MKAIERAANLLQARLSWPQAEGCARDLADAGLLITDEDRAVLDAAYEAYMNGGLDGRSRLGRAVEARRKATR